MPEVMDPEIKLFGRKIVLPENCRGFADKDFSVVSSDDSIGRGTRAVACDRLGDGIVTGEVLENQEDCDEVDFSEFFDKVSAIFETKCQDEEQEADAEKDDQDLDTMSDADENPKTPSIEEDNASTTHPKSDNEQINATNSQQKVLKKPDKILPCPRCNSMDTKFCYYNNYNISQPRHFCKSCQRYWTAGGTMRNIPVGAGRRKNKNSASNCHIMITEALQASIIDGYNVYHQSAFKPNDTVLSFGPDSPLCKSMASAMKIEDKCVSNCNVDQGGLVSCKCKENNNDLSDGSSVNTLNSVANGVKIDAQHTVMAINPFQPPVPCIPGVSWQLPWNPAVQLPAVFPPCGFPMPFYPAPYWNCGAPNSWNSPWLQVPSPIVNQKATSSGPSSPLGKHSRNGKLLNPSNSDGEDHSGQQSSESSIVVPKTLRIDDPEEAAKSSIWETLGIKYDSLSREGLFKALQPKCDKKKTTSSTSPGLLQANPAALSRSITFQESA